MPRKRLWPRLAIGLLAAAAVGGTAWYFFFQATKFVPPYYVQALAVDPQESKSQSEQCLQRAAELSNDVRLSDRWESQFSADELNGWLAVDLPENFPDTLPPEVSEPRIVLADGEATIAFRYNDGKLSTVISARIGAFVPEPNQLAIRIRSLRAGRLPLPISRLIESINQAAENWDLPLVWQQVDGDPVAIVQIPESERSRPSAILRTVEIADGTIYLAGETSKRD